jgi:hypothetical protein
MKLHWVLFLIVVLACSVCAHAVIPTCFINVSWNTISHSYIGNTAYPYVLVQGGINIPTGCYTTKVTFLAYYIDNVSPGDRLDLGLYCLSGECAVKRGNQRIVHLGGLAVNSGDPTTSFFPCLVGTSTQPATCQTGQQPFRGTMITLHWVEGRRYLPPGNYMWAMDDTCSPPNGQCSQALGEGWYRTQMFSFKYFTKNEYVTCIQQNLGELPSALPSSCVGTGGPTNNWGLAAPHIIAAVIY